MSNIYAIKRYHKDGTVSYYKKGGTDKTPVDKAHLYYTQAQAQYRLREEQWEAKSDWEFAAEYPKWAERSNLVVEVQIVEVEVSIREKAQVNPVQSVG